MQVLSNPSPRVESTPENQKPTSIDSIIYKHATHTKLRHFVGGKSEWKLSNPWGDKLDSPPFLIPPG